MTSLDIDHVQSQFPGLNGDWIFFDNAGGAQIARPALDRMVEFLTHHNVQIGGSYAVSEAAAQALMAGRQAAATQANAARPEEIVFDPSTTVLMGNLMQAMRRQFAPGDEVIVTLADHESNIGPWTRLKEFGVVIKVWPLNAGTMDLQLSDLEPLMTARTRLVCVTQVSNILGKVHPVADFARFVHDRGALICVDAVAYAPHRLIDGRAWDVDYYVFSLYKAYGPHGALMYGKYDLLAKLDGPYHYFYGKDKVTAKLKPGNPSYEAAYASDGILEYLTSLARHHGATGRPPAGLAVRAQRLPHHRGAENRSSTRVPTIAFKFEGVDSGVVARAMDEHGIAMRFGDLHSRRLVEYLAEDRDGGVLRVSMVHYNMVEQIDRLTEALSTILA